MEPIAGDGWNDERTARWIRQAEGIERQLQPVSHVLFQAAALRVGERVLDVGCGTGPTTRQAAELVGPTGRVTGVDVTAEMLAAAAAIAPEPGAAPIEWLLADPVDGLDPSPGHDIVLSRFGVMFFSDPHPAFENLAAATVPGGRLAIATWARRRESEMFEVPFQAALAVLGRSDDLPDDEGPFSLHDPSAIRDLLEGAGWRVVDTAIHHLRLPYAGGGSATTAAQASLDSGPTRIVTKDLDGADQRRVVERIAEALRPYEVAGTVLLGGTVLITSAGRR